MLIGVANGAPILVRKILGRRFRYPVDGNACFIDGRPLLGSSKTLIGLLSALLLTPWVAVVINLPMQVGWVIAFWCMVGDMLSSFIKRRVGLPVHAQATGLDQIPESLFPALAYQYHYGLSPAGLALVVFGFFFAEIFLSRWLYRWRIRNKPY